MRNSQNTCQSATDPNKAIKSVLVFRHSTGRCCQDVAYDLSCVYRETLIEIIKDGFGVMNFEFMSVDIDKLYQLYLDQVYQIS